MRAVHTAANYSLKSGFASASERAGKSGPLIYIAGSTTARLAPVALQRHSSGDEQIEQGDKNIHHEIWISQFALEQEQRDIATLRATTPSDDGSPQTSIT